MNFEENALCTNWPVLAVASSGALSTARVAHGLGKQPTRIIYLARKSEMHNLWRTCCFDRAMRTRREVKNVPMNSFSPRG